MARTMGDDDQQTAAAKSGVNASTVSRWLKYEDAGRRAESVISFARAYAVSPLKALVEAGLLEPAEARMRPAAAPDFTQLTNDELLELVRARMREEGEGHGRPAATNMPPGPTPLSERRKAMQQVQEAAARDKKE